MNSYEDAIFCSYCDKFSCYDPQEELAHIIKRHKHAPNVQGLRALDNRKRCRLCVHKNGYDHAKVIIDQSALDKHMDKVHPRWEDLYPQC
ncbi:hypothetical protein GBA52_008938 [Prunus armeniaca]|nr:hypothetical protein GBA52_008938 [Prunus armeniaca]